MNKLKVGLYFVLVTLFCFTSCLTLSISSESENADADMSSAIFSNLSLLGNAIYYNNTDDAVALLDSGANPNEMHDRVSTIALAAINGNVTIVQKILEHPSFSGIDEYSVFSYPDGSFGVFTPLYAASTSGNPYVIELLLNHGADPNIVSYSGMDDGERLVDSVVLLPLVTAFAEIDSETNSIEDCKKYAEVCQRMADKTKDVNMILDYRVHLPKSQVQYVYGYNDPAFMAFGEAAYKYSLFMHLAGSIGDVWNETERMLEMKPYMNEILFSLIDRGVKLNYSFSTSTDQTVAQLESYDAATKKQLGINDDVIQALKLMQKYLTNGNTLSIVANPELLDYALKNGGSIKRSDDGGSHYLQSTFHIPTLKYLIHDCGYDINMTNWSGYALINNIVGLDNDTGVLEAALKLGANPNHLLNGQPLEYWIQGRPSSEKKKALVLLKQYGYKY